MTVVVSNPTTTPAIALTPTAGLTGNQFPGTPDGTPGALAMRSLVVNDIPALPESKITNLVSDLAGKQATGNYITGITGDIVATGPGSVVGTLATVNSSPGAVGSASQTITETVNGKGLTTASSAIPIQIAESQVTGLVADIAALKLSIAAVSPYVDPNFFYSQFS
jgi:hypothetical protein